MAPFGQDLESSEGGGLIALFEGANSIVEAGSCRRSGKAQYQGTNRVC